MNHHQPFKWTYLLVWAMLSLTVSSAKNNGGMSFPFWRPFSLPSMIVDSGTPRQQQQHRRRRNIHEDDTNNNNKNNQNLQESTQSIRAGAIGPTTVAAAAVATKTPISYYLRVALAGGVAGATGTAVLYPMDSAKTLRQSNPNMYSSVRQAFMKLIHSSTTNSWHISHAYRGIVPAALGAIPSSALYFGAYESSKLALSKLLLNDNDDTTTNPQQQQRRRLLVHGLAAASGNTISSAVFVPKEVIKQQLQYASKEMGAASVGSVVAKVLQEKGIKGLYAGYQATLMRNIPSAMLRFVLYEELKRKWASSLVTPAPTTTTGPEQQSKPNDNTILPQSVRIFAAGAVAGAMASGIMTPVDVMKTRMATGTCPLGVKNCMLHIAKETGWKGLYAGAGSRMMWSGAFSAIGFGTFELVKKSLGVSDRDVNSRMMTTETKKKQNEEHKTK